MSVFTQDQLIRVMGVCVIEEDYCEHQRATLYVGHFVEITEDLVPEVLEEVGIDVSDLIGKRIYAHGTYDSVGTEYFEAFVQEKTETVVPAWTEVIEHPETIKVVWGVV